MFEQKRFPTSFVIGAPMFMVAPEIIQKLGLAPGSKIVAQLEAKARESRKKYDAAVARHEKEQYSRRLVQLKQG